jgi:hypothetical protein
VQPHTKQLVNYWLLLLHLYLYPLRQGFTLSITEGHRGHSLQDTYLQISSSSIQPSAPRMDAWRPADWHTEPLACSTGKHWG